MPAPSEAHGPDEVGGEPVEDAVDAALAGGAEAVEVGAAGHGRGGAGGDGLDDVAAAPDAAVADDLDAAADGVGDRGDERERGGRAVELAAAVVGQARWRRRRARRRGPRPRRSGCP